MKNSTQNTVDYLDGFQYAGNQLQFFPTTEGYVKATPTDRTKTSYHYNYIYNYTDHLGNVRLSYTLDPQAGTLKIVDEHHYYPFGLKHGVYTAATLKDFRIDEMGTDAVPGGGMGEVALINVTPDLADLQSVSFSLKQNIRYIYPFNSRFDKKAIHISVYSNSRNSE
ncbi:MAG TPA: hypothetical protein VL022_02010 [Moheibacter sp.]|nr:hypothetical protein [Moheibacter sp.]